MGMHEIEFKLLGICVESILRDEHHKLWRKMLDWLLMDTGGMQHILYVRAVGSTERNSNSSFQFSPLASRFSLLASCFSLLASCFSLLASRFSLLASRLKGTFAVSGLKQSTANSKKQGDDLSDEDFVPPTNANNKTSCSTF